MGCFHSETEWVGWMGVEAGSMSRLRDCLCIWLSGVEIRILTSCASRNWIEINPLLCEPQIGQCLKQTNKQTKNWGQLKSPRSQICMIEKRVTENLGAQKDENGTGSSTCLYAPRADEKASLLLEEAPFGTQQHPACTRLSQNRHIGEC